VQWLYDLHQRFRLPGPVYELIGKKSHIDELTCVKCGLCAEVCVRGGDQMKKDIAIAGVGGQGNIFASHVIYVNAVSRGFNVLALKPSARLNAVVRSSSHVRISDGPIWSPLIPAGLGDVLWAWKT
jgi:ferredoxin